MALDALHRPIRLTLRLAESRRLVIDPGTGERVVPLAAPGEPLFSGDHTLAATGWRRGQGAFLWRIRDDFPAPFSLLAAQTELKVNA